MNLYTGAGAGQNRWARLQRDIIHNIRARRILRGEKLTKLVTYITRLFRKHYTNNCTGRPSSRRARRTAIREKGGGGSSIRRN